MAKSITAPYRVLEEQNSLLTVSWANPGDGTNPFDGAFLDAFTPSDKKELEVIFDIQPEALSRYLHLSLQAELALSASVLCPATRKIFSTPNILVKATDNAGKRTAKITLPENVISDYALFECRLVLANDAAPPDSLGAKFKSSLLWKHRIKVMLEGNAPMFPVTAERFREDFGGPAAGWKMTWKKATLLSSPSKVRLVMNSDNVHLKELLKQPSADGLSPAQSLLQYCVACSMLENMCVRFAPAFKEIPPEQLTEGTLGYNLVMFFNKFFYPKFATISDLIEAYADDPEHCRAVLQSKIPGTIIHA